MRGESERLENVQLTKRRRIMGGTVQHSIPQAAQQWMIKVSASPTG